jgi:hypothetical protein
VLTSDRTEQAAREQAVKRLHPSTIASETRIQTMYMDKLDGRINQEFFDTNSATWRAEEGLCYGRSKTSRPPHRHLLIRQSR